MTEKKTTYHDQAFVELAELMAKVAEVANKCRRRVNKKRKDDLEAVVEEVAMKADDIAFTPCCTEMMVAGAVVATMARATMLLLDGETDAAAEWSRRSSWFQIQLDVMRAARAFAEEIRSKEQARDTDKMVH